MNKIQTWMEKYEKDTENVDLKIQIKRNEYMDRLNTRINLEETVSFKTWILKRLKNVSAINLYMSHARVRATLIKVVDHTFQCE